MRRAYYLIFTLSVLLGVLTPTPAVGGSKKKKAAPSERHEPTISAVTPNTITVTEESGAMTFTITQFTEIYVNERKAKVADLKAGMTVSVTVGSDPVRASRIDASSK